MKYLLILLCFPLCFAIDIGHADSDITMVANVSMASDIPDPIELDVGGDGAQSFNLPALLSTLTDLSVNPAQMMSVITLLSHMIYEASDTLIEIEAGIVQRTTERATAETQAVAVETAAAQQAAVEIANGDTAAAQLRGHAQTLLDEATDRNTTFYPILTDERDTINSVIDILGGNNLDCMPGYPSNACGHLWANNFDGPTSEDECLQHVRATTSNSALARGIMWHPNRHCRTFDMDAFDACGIEWIPSNFQSHPWRVCRVVIVDDAAGVDA
jgi:hypothetical protein